MSWILVIIFGGACALLGYFWGKKRSLDLSSFEHSSQSRDSDTTREHIKDESLSDPLSMTEALSPTYAANTVNAINTASSTRRVLDEEITIHPLYKSLSEQNTTLEKQVAELQSFREKSVVNKQDNDETTVVNEKAKAATLSDEEVKQHPLYRHLHEQFIELQTHESPDDEDYLLQQSAVIKELQQENETLRLDLENCEENIIALRHRQLTEEEHAKLNKKIIEPTKSHTEDDVKVEVISIEPEDT